MRCLALADRLRQNGSKVTFVCRDGEGNMSQQLKDHQTDVHWLVSSGPKKSASRGQLAGRELYAGWVGTSEADDAAQTYGVIRNLNAPTEWLIVDHYGLGIEWEKRLRPYVGRIMVIDDLADRSHECDLLLDQNLARKAGDYSGLAPQPCQKIIGPQYALLRPEFAGLREYSLARRKTPLVRRLLITMGGIDLSNSTEEILGALTSAPLQRTCKITVVMGGQSPWLTRVQQKAETMPFNTEVLVDVNNMAQIMADSDLAIGSGGSTSWERCCLGVPALLTALAENQTQTVTSLEKEGAAIAFQIDEGLKRWLPIEISRIENNKKILTEMAMRASGLTDGRGCDRVVERLYS